MPFSSLLEFSKWHKSIQYRYNAGASCIGRTSSSSNNAAAQQSPPRPNASAKTKTGATLSPLCQEDLINTTGPRHLSCSPAHDGHYGVSSRDTAPSAGGLPAHQMAKREPVLGPSVPSGTPLQPSSPTLSCPDDCDSKKFCDPSSCALESVREANVIAEELRG